MNYFKYLGSWVDSTVEDLRIRKGLAWAVANKSTKIWKSNISRNLKERLFLATVESVILYGSKAWPLTKSLEKQLDGCYTRLLRMVFNVHWKEQVTNEELYRTLMRFNLEIPV